VVGFYSDPGAELWDFLRERGDAALEAHYALWARCYGATDAEPHKCVMRDVPQFCSDLGHAKQKAGGFKRRDKQHAMRLLDALTTAELTVEARVGKKVNRPHGPIWARGVAAEQRDEYGDLFGSARAGARDRREPVAFSYRPEPWFEDEDWRKRNAFVGMVGVGGRRPADGQGSPPSSCTLSRGRPPVFGLTRLTQCRRRRQLPMTGGLIPHRGRRRR